MSDTLFYEALNKALRSAKTYNYGQLTDHEFYRGHVIFTFVDDNRVCHYNLDGVSYDWYARYDMAQDSCQDYLLSE